MRKDQIPLFYWSEIQFIFKKKENYGDLLSKYVVEKISGRKVKWVHPKNLPWHRWNKRNYLAIGSIIHHATKDSIVWGSGIIDRKQKVENADFRAVRGPRTREFLLNRGYNCPQVYGDPALLLPQFFNPPVEKKYRLAVIPHYHDYNLAKKIFEGYPDILVIDLMTLDIEDVTMQIMSCEKSISSSLHGLIVSHAYKIPSVWVEFSKKLFGDGIKYVDYFESVGITPYDPTFLENAESFISDEFFSKFPFLPREGRIEEIVKSLKFSCPF